MHGGKEKLDYSEAKIVEHILRPIFDNLSIATMPNSKKTPAKKPAKALKPSAMSRASAAVGSNKPSKPPNARSTRTTQQPKAPKSRTSAKLKAIEEKRQSLSDAYEVMLEMERSEKEMEDYDGPNGYDGMKGTMTQLELDEHAREVEARAPRAAETDDEGENSSEFDEDYIETLSSSDDGEDTEPEEGEEVSAGGDSEADSVIELSSSDIENESAQGAEADPAQKERAPNRGSQHSAATNPPADASYEKWVKLQAGVQAVMNAESQQMLIDEQAKKMKFLQHQLDSIGTQASEGLAPALVAAVKPAVVTSAPIATGTQIPRSEEDTQSMITEPSGVSKKAAAAAKRLSADMLKARIKQKAKEQGRAGTAGDVEYLVLMEEEHEEAAISVFNTHCSLPEGPERAVKRKKHLLAATDLFTHGPEGASGPAYRQVWSQCGPQKSLEMVALHLLKIPVPEELNDAAEKVAASETKTLEVDESGPEVFVMPAGGVGATAEGGEIVEIAVGQKGKTQRGSKIVSTVDRIITLPNNGELSQITKFHPASGRSFIEVNQKKR